MTPCPKRLQVRADEIRSYATYQEIVPLKVRDGRG